MNGGRLWRWSPDKESLVTLSRSLKDLSCSRLYRYPALYLYLMFRSAVFQNTATTGSSVNLNRPSVLPNGLLVPPNNSYFDPQPYRGSFRPRFLAVRILPFSRVSAAFRVHQDTSQSARGLTGLTDLTVPYHNLLLLSNTCL